MFCMCIPWSAWAEAVEIDGIYYNLVEKAKQAEVTYGPDGSGAYTGDIVIPENIEYNGNSYAVTSIAKNAFQYSSISSIEIPNSITSIGDDAFFNSNGLTSVTIPSSVKSIGSYAFYSCGNLSSVDIQYGLTNIGYYAFAYCHKLADVNIPSSVTNIEGGTFSNCTGLHSFTIPTGINSVSSSMFEGCTNLQTIVIPDNINTIGSATFKNCSSLTSVILGAGVQTIFDEAFSECKNLETVYCHVQNVPWTSENAFADSYIDYATLVVPMEALENYQSSTPWSNFGTIKAFTDIAETYPIYIDGIYYQLFADGTAKVVSGATAYTGSVTIPESVSHDGKEYSVTTIAEKAFQGCSGLTGVDIPESVKTIGDYAFSGCNNMTQVTVAWLSPLAINSTVFPNRANCTLYVPQGCQALYQAADYWKEFKEIIDPTIDDDSVDGIFYTYDTEKYTATVTGAKSDLQEVNIPDNVTYEGRVYTVTKIARAAFQDHDMAAVIVPFTMKEIGYDAFRGCKNLVSMKVRSYYEYMQQLVSPFVVQEGITNVDVDGTMDPASKGVNRSLAVMEEEAVYDSRNDCNAIIHKATNMLMAGCQTTVIPEDVVKIGDHAFYGQTNLTSISIPSSVTILGSGAFYDCKNLESVVLNEGLVTIGSCAFLNCEKLGSIKIPISVKKIDEFAFVNCKSLNKAIVSDLSAWCAISFINRDSNPIFRSGKLYSDENTEVKELVIPEEVTSIGNYAFYNCDGITSVTLPSSLTSIGSSAFYACDNITSVSLPATVTAIGQDALMGCDLLTTITAYMTAPPTLTAQFANAEKITLYVPRGTKALYEAADYWKDFMEIIEMEEVIDVTDISQLDVAIYTDNVEINKGTQATLSVKMKNNVVAEGFEFNLRLPDGMDVALDQDGFPMVALSTERTNSRKTNTFETVIQNDGSLHILGASTNGSTISGNDGEIVLVTVNVSDEMKEGSYPIVIENIVISDEMAKAYEVESVTSAITIVDYTAGDVNMDGKVNVADYTAIAHHIMGNTPNVFNKKAADANGDGKINVADLTAVAHLIMYGSVERPKSLPMVINPE